MPEFVTGAHYIEPQEPQMTAAESMHAAMQRAYPQPELKADWEINPSLSRAAQEKRNLGYPARYIAEEEPTLDDEIASLNW